MKKAVIMIGAILFSSLSAAAAVNKRDVVLADRALVGSEFEEQSSKLALRKATDPQIRQFAKRMLIEHRAAENSLLRALRPLGIEPRAKLSPALKAQLAKMRSKSGQAFNRTYLQDQRRAHALAVAMLQDYQRNGSNPRLKAWVRQTLPKVREHQAHVNSL